MIYIQDSRPAIILCIWQKARKDAFHLTCGTWANEPTIRPSSTKGHEDDTNVLETSSAGAKHNEIPFTCLFSLFSSVFAGQTSVRKRHNVPFAKRFWRLLKSLFQSPSGFWQFLTLQIPMHYQCLEIEAVHGKGGKHIGVNLLRAGFKPKGALFSGLTGTASATSAGFMRLKVDRLDPITKRCNFMKFAKLRPPIWWQAFSWLHQRSFQPWSPMCDGNRSWLHQRSF